MNSIIFTLIILFLFSTKRELDNIGLVKIDFGKRNLLYFLFSIIGGFFLFMMDKILLKIERNLIKNPQNSKKEIFFYGYGFKNMLKIYSSFYFLVGLVFFSFWEELLFRGVAIYFLTKSVSFSKINSVIIVSIFFGIYHIFISRASILPKFFGGLFLGFFFIYTKNLFFPFISHLVWNVFIWKEWRKLYWMLLGKEGIYEK
jgi:membrane protease YdiL (CAAX protease family)